MSKEKDEQNIPPQDADQAGRQGADGTADAPRVPDGAEDAAQPPQGEDASSGVGGKKPFHFTRPIEELYDVGASHPADEQAAAASGGAGGPPNGEDQPAEEEPAPKKRRWLQRLLYVMALLVVSAVIALFIISVFADRYGIGKPDQKVDVTIPKGATAADIADVLKKDGVINNTFAFRIFVRQNKISGFQAGVYTVNPSQGYEEIIAVLRDADQNKNNVTVTIPEGLTIQQIAAALEQKGVCTQQDFLNALDAGGYDLSIDMPLPNDPNRYYRYEGYLFPDTYTFLKNSSGKTAVQKMIANFNAKVSKADVMATARQRGMNVDQIITLASIIQKEAASQAVMADVSSTFYNRLRVGVNGKKLLQSDATVLYAKRDLTAALHSADAALDSHYNTYRYEGLPPGPICNPGLDAINAALNPSTTDYLYFVSDANGKYYFAATFADHVKNVKKAAKAGAAKAPGDLSSSS